MSASALLLAACGRADAPANQAASSDTLVFASGPRDRLCLQRREGGRTGFITYAAQGNANCSVRGRFDPGSSAIIPEGDQRCRIPVAVDGSTATLRDGGPACAYYCGPSASFGGKRFEATAPFPPPADFAGEPLC